MHRLFEQFLRFIINRNQTCPLKQVLYAWLEIGIKKGSDQVASNSMYVPVSDHNLNICCNSTINIGLHVLITGFQAPTACILGESTFIFPHLNDDQLLVPLFSHHSFHKSTNPGFSLLRRADILSKVKLPRRHRGSL